MKLWINFRLKHGQTISAPINLLDNARKFKMTTMVQKYLQVDVQAHYQN